MQREPGGGHREPGRVGQPDGDIEVVGDPLEFGVQHPNQARGRRRLAARDFFDRVAEGQGVGDGGNALGAFGQEDAVGHRHPGEPVLHAVVLVEHPHVQVRIASPGVSTRYSIDSTTPERTARGIVKIP